MIAAAQSGGYLAFKYVVDDLFSRLMAKSQYTSRAKARARKTPDGINPIEETAIDAEDSVIMKEFIRKGALEAYLILTPLTSGINGLFAAPNGVLTSAGLGIGSVLTNVSNIAFNYYIGATQYQVVANTVGISPGRDVIPIGMYGAIAYDINASGVITLIKSPGNTAGYATAGLALLDLPPCASSMARMGTVTATNTIDVFTFGTTALNAANTAVAFDSLSYISTGLCGYLFDNPIFAPNTVLITINQKEWMVDDISVKLNEAIADVICEFALVEWYKINEQFDDMKLHEIEFQKSISDLNTVSHMRKKNIVLSLNQP